jgi:hypothetical protein
MLIHNHTIEIFLEKCLTITKDILTHEMGLKVHRTRFEFKHMLYPIHLVCFETKDKLGFFDFTNYRIGIHKFFVTHINQIDLKNVLRHELAHYYAYLVYGRDIDAHGVEFRSICKQFTWGEEVYLSQFKPEIEEKIHANLKMVEKIKKLLNLAQSSNAHEAELATTKANQLLVQYHLETVSHGVEKTYFLKQVLSSKVKSGKLYAIYEILTSFMVQPVMNHTKNGIVLEVTGGATEVELADYVANFLDHELDFIWKQAQKEDKRLKGMKAKNSFYRSLAAGYLAKIKESHSTLNSTQSKALVAISQDLEIASQAFYGRFSRSYSRHSVDLHASAQGEKAGRNLNIKKGVSSKITGLFLPKN